MKNYLFDTILAFLLFVVSKTAFNPHGVNLDIVTIYDISTSDSVQNYQPKGSIAGGTEIRITCVGQDLTNNELNKVLIGPYECKILDDGITEIDIKCITSEAHDSQRLENQPVELFVYGKQQSICQGNCVFSYVKSLTPYLRHISPSAQTPHNDVNWNGIYRINNTGDIKSMKFTNDKYGSENCNRLQLSDEVAQVTNFNDDSYLNPNAWVDLQCTVSCNQVAGLYDLLLEEEKGNSIELSTLDQYTKEGEQYQFAVIPEIKNISQNVAGNYGSKLTIEGNGFGYIKEDVQISAGGLDCEIETLTNQEITCEVAQGSTENSSAQYIKGQGAQVTYYHNTGIGSAATLFQKVQNGQAQEKYSQKIINAWDLNSIPTYTGAKISGYFYAPRTGSYNFWVSGDDSAGIYLNQTPMDQTITSENLITYRCRHSNIRNYLYPNDCGFRSEDQAVELTEGNYYWLEAYAYNGGGAGHFQLAVETPEIPDSPAQNTVPNLKKFTIAPKIRQQKWSIKVWTHEGPFGIKFFTENPNDIRPLFDTRTAEYTWSEWDATLFQNEIQAAAGGFAPEVQQFTLDNNGQRCSEYETPSECVVDGKEFILVFTEYRTPEYKNATPELTRNILGSQYQITLLQEQYAKVLSGHYKLSINGDFIQIYYNDEWTYDIPYDANSSMIEAGIYKLTGVDSIEVDHTGSPDFGYTFWFKFRDFGTENVNIKIKNYMLGEMPNTRPNIQLENLVNASTRLLYEPIPFDFAFLDANLPSVQVTVNGILSTVALGTDNSYQALEENTPIISQYSIDSQELSFILVEGSVSFENDQVQATYGYIQCSSYDGTSCTLLGQLEAGDHTPEIFVEGIGYAKVDSDFVPQNSTILPQIISVFPSIGSVYGECIVFITGFNYSTNLERTVVTFGEIEAKILYITSTNIVLVLPSQITDDSEQQDFTDPLPLTITVNDVSQTTDFQYTTHGVPTISDVNPRMASPVQKGTVTITGTNFGEDESDIEVQLLHQDTKEIAYNLFLQSVQEEEIRATLSGGRVGVYLLQVVKKSLGRSIQQVEFSYQIEVHNVQPRVGSILGGTVLTITGQNFSNTDIDNNVFITKGQNERVNLQCKILTATESEITCVTPPKKNSWGNNQNVKIYVQGRLVEESICNGTCDFQYSQDATPLVRQTVLVNEEEVEYVVTIGGEDSVLLIEGSNFPEGSVATLKCTDEISVEGIVTAEDELRFEQLPEIPAGTYQALVYIENLGNAGTVKLEVEFSLNSVVPQDLSIQGGILTLTGKGFDTNAYITIDEDEDEECIVLSRTPSEIKCLAPRFGNQDRTRTLKLEQGGIDSVTHNTEIDYTNIQTPTIQLVDASNTSFGATNLIIPVQNENFITENPVVTPYLIKKIEQTVTYAGVYENNSLSFTSHQIPAGEYYLQVQIEGLGFAKFSSSNKVLINVTLSLQIESVETSLFGGHILEINGSGFETENLYDNVVKVCGTRCIPREESTFDQLLCDLPVISTRNIRNHSEKLKNLETIQVVNQFSPCYCANQLSKFEIPANLYADNISQLNIAIFQYSEFFKKRSSYQSSGGSSCYIGYDLGEELRFDLSAVYIDLEASLINGNPNLYGAFLQTSTDGVNWTNLIEFDESNFTDSNQYNSEDYGEDIELFQYIRVYNPNNSDCRISGFEVEGYSYFKDEIEDDSGFVCDVSVRVNNGEKYVFDNKVTYNGDLTSKVENIYPYWGWQRGGDEITITGNGFGTEISEIEVIIDGISCVVSSVSNTEIVCTTGNKGDQNYSEPSLVVKKGGYHAIIPDGLFFYYGLLWTQDITWGLEAAPREGDSVYVPEGRTLIVDQSSPKYINTIVNEGRIIFADLGEDLEFHVKYFINKNSELIIGTAFNLYQSQITINLYGNLQDKQLPCYGVKVIACHHCTIDIHGAEKFPVWTFIETTVNPGESTLTTQVLTNWQVGDKLVLATTDFDGRHSEEITIETIENTSNSSTITFSPSLQYTHISTSETYSGKELKMQAEIGNLSRNILIQGNPEDNELEKFGGHLMLHGKKSVARIENAEFTRTGQPRIIGRYAMYLHNLRNSRTSYILNNSVHHSYARMIAIKNVKKLKIKNNVAFWNAGHNIFLEQGKEQKNKILHNLIVSPRSAYNMFQTDITVAGIWVSNPKNKIHYNHVAGSQFYGIQYDFPEKVRKQCPSGKKLLSSQHNVLHSNESFGLRIHNLQSRKYPCKPLRGNLFSEEDPWAANPSIQSLFYNFTIYKNGETGVVAEELGNTRFKNFIIADNYYAGFQAHLTNFTKEEVILENSLIVGQSLYTQQSSTEQELEYLQNAGQSAIQTSRTHGFRVRNVDIHHQKEGSFIITMSSLNNHNRIGVQGGKQFNIEQVTIQNSENAQKLNWLGGRYNLVYDVDGTFSNTQVPTYITPYYPHLDLPIEQNKCTYNQDTQDNFDDSVFCTGTKLRAIPIGNLQNYNLFKYETMKVINLNDAQKAARFNTTDEIEEDFGLSQQRWVGNKARDGLTDYAFVYATDYVYNIHWNHDLDWKHLQIYPSQLAENDDKTIIFRFNFTEQRELFDVFKREGKKLTFEQFKLKTDRSLFYNEDGTPNSSAGGCALGDYYVDQDEKTLSICINNKERTTKYQAIDVNGVYCRRFCPVNGFGNCNNEDEPKRYRYFSTDSDWLQENSESPVAIRKLPHEENYSVGVPREGDDVIIPCSWTVIFDVESFRFATLIVDGTLVINESFEYAKIQANNIWVRAGTIEAGSEIFPYTKKFDIELYGDANGTPLQIDENSHTGTKSFAVTGNLKLYAIAPETTQTRLTTTAYPGNYTITVASTSELWAVGDELVLGGSALDGTGFEKVKISSINENTITLESPIESFHYGGEKASISTSGNGFVNIESKFGQSGLDMRTTVGHISRRIRIRGTGEFGGHLQVYHWFKYEETQTETTDINLKGNAVLSGVELENMGQVNSENAGLHISYTQRDSQISPTILENSSIHDCEGICINLQTTYNTQITNNVIYNGQQFLINNENYKSSTINNNLLIGAVSNPYTNSETPETFINMSQSYDPSTDSVSVQGNVGQSTQGLGFAFPSTPCGKLEQIAFKNNEAGNCKERGILYRFNSDGCYGGGHNSIYHAQEAIVAYSSSTTEVGWILEKNIIAECTEGVIMYSGSNNNRQHHNYLKTTYISGLVLGESCPECYTQSHNQVHFSCSNQYAAKLLLTNLKGHPSPTGVLHQQSPTAISSSMFINNCEFSNFRDDDYTNEYLELESDVCGNNRVFITNENAYDAQAAHYLRNTKCTKCDKDGMFRLDEPNQNWQGWYGGCGIMDCTGLENVMVQDITGHFFGTPATAISNNEDVGYGLRDETSEMEDTCQFVPAWNGFLCERTDFTQLQWEAISSDRKKLSNAPVTVTNPYFKNFVNMWREWTWKNNKPRNRRQNSYVSLALVNERHNITYSGTQPIKMFHKLAERNTEGENNRYVIIEYQYFNPLSIQVRVNGRRKRSFSFKNPKVLEEKSTICGANNYYFQNSTIHFVITNEPDCTVVVRQKNHVRVNMRVKMSKKQFYEDEEIETTFINRIIGFLDIPFDRVRIVGIAGEDYEFDNIDDGNRRILQEQEAELQVLIDGEEPGDATTNYDPAADYLELQGLAEDLQQGVNSGEIDGASSAQYEILVLKEAGSDSNSNDYFTEDDLPNDKKLIELEDEGTSLIAIIILLGVIACMGLLGAAIYTCHLKNKKNEKSVNKVQVLPRDWIKIEAQNTQSVPNSKNELDQLQI